MITKARKLRTVLSCAATSVCLLSGHAGAQVKPSDSEVDRIWADHYGVIEGVNDFNNGLWIYGLDTSPNPGDCSDTKYAVPHHNIRDSEMLHRTIMNAYLNGKSVKLLIAQPTKYESACSKQGRPQYYGVAVRDASPEEADAADL